MRISYYVCRRCLFYPVEWHLIAINNATTFSSIENIILSDYKTKVRESYMHVCRYIFISVVSPY